MSKINGKKRTKQDFDPSQFGQLTKTCLWIINADDRDIDIKYRHGLNQFDILGPKINGNGRAQWSVTPESLIYIASEIFGMPENDEWFIPIKKNTEFIPPSLFRSLPRLGHGHNFAKLTLSDKRRWEILGHIDFLDETIQHFAEIECEGWD